MSKSLQTATVGEPSHVSFNAYVTGFILSLFLTITAYLFVTHHLFNKTVLVICVVVLALIQFMVQLFYFLHMGRETKPRWKLLVFLLMLLIVLILVFGSLWIMNNLNYHMTTQQMENYMQNQDGL